MANDLFRPVRTVSHRLVFPNGYMLSVVRHQFSYGNREGLFEVAILDSDTDDFVRIPEVLGVSYDDVRGWLSIKQVIEIAKKLRDYK